MGGMVDSLFGGGKEQGYKDLQNQIGQGMGARKQYEGSAEQAYGPYFNQQHPFGLQQYQSQLDKMQNPTGFMNDLMKNYQMSPFAQNQMQEGTRAMDQGAAASGMLGSGQLLKDLQKYGQQVSSGDMQQYLNNALGINNTYLQGYGNLQNQGFNAAGNVAGMRNDLGNNLAGDYANMGAAQFGQDTAHSGAMQGLLNSVGGMAMGALTGGMGYLPGILSGWGGAGRGAIQGLTRWNMGSNK